VYLCKLILLRANSEKRADGERSIDLYDIDGANPVFSLFAEKIGMLGSSDDNEMSKRSPRGYTIICRPLGPNRVDDADSSRHSRVNFIQLTTIVR